MGKEMTPLRWLFEASNGSPEVVIAFDRDEAFSLTTDPTAKLLDSAPLLERWTWPVRWLTTEGRSQQEWTFDPTNVGSVPEPRVSNGVASPVHHRQL